MRSEHCDHNVVPNRHRLDPASFAEGLRNGLTAPGSAVRAEDKGHVRFLIGAFGCAVRLVHGPLVVFHRKVDDLLAGFGIDVMDSVFVPTYVGR